MKSKDVEIGAVYKAIVSGKLCRVRILRLADSGYGHRGRDYRKQWFALNLATGREIFLRSARRLTEVAPKLGRVEPEPDGAPDAADDLSGAEGDVVDRAYDQFVDDQLAARGKA
jgi:hypothetical protein